MLNLQETGKNIKEIREVKGLSQEKAAEKANISRNRWQEIEYGCENMTVDTLRRIAAALGVSPITLGILKRPDGEIRLMWIQTWHRTEWKKAGIEIGQTIHHLRKARNITQRELANRSKVSCARLRDIEHGCANVTIVVLDKIAEALGLSLLEIGMLTVSEAEFEDMVQRARAVI